MRRRLHRPRFLGGKLHAILEEPDGWGKDILQNTLLQEKTIQHMPENMVRDLLYTSSTGLVSKIGEHTK